VRPDFPPGQVQRGDTTIPWWQGSFASGGATFTYRMVGTDPAAGSAATTVPVVLVPLRLVFDGDGTVIEDGAMAGDLVSSPLFQPTRTRTAFTQYPDAVQRESLWDTVSTRAPGYHVLLGQPQVLAVQTLHVPADKGVARYYGDRPFGLVQDPWFHDHLIQLMDALQIPSTSLPIFVAENATVVVEKHDVTSCFDRPCESYVADHGVQVVGEPGSTGPHPVHTFIYAQYPDFGNEPPSGFPPNTDFGTEPLSHELVEWMADPFIDNLVPPWKSQVNPRYPCSNLLEVSDPVENVGFFLPGAPGYLLDDAAYFPWFSREQPSSAWGGLYDVVNATQGEPSAPC
jgi:hypothetical protein